MGMKTAKSLLLIYILGLVILLGVASFQRSPGYMDAEYYYGGAIQLYQGQGFNEMILWNYLDDPEGLPHPSHGYWMPLASLLALAGMSLLKSSSYAAARLGFVLIASLIPPLTMWLSLSLNQRRDYAWLAGLLSVVPVFYLVYLPVTDTFGLCMVLGAAWFLLLSRMFGNETNQATPNRIHLLAFLLGVIAGIMHLARVEGIIWFLVSLLGVGFTVYRMNGSQEHKGVFWNALVAYLFGYSVIVGPWFFRNLQVFGSPVAPGGIRGLWLLSYDDLFSYPASRLTFQSWWGQGILEILLARLWALGQNVQTIVAVQGGIVLFPLILLGLWQFRRDQRIRWAMFAWCLIFILMTIVFPFQGARGGFFHGAAAFQPLFFALVPAGLDGFIQWGVRNRKWNPDQARGVFRWGLLGLVFILSGLVVMPKLVEQNDGYTGWNSTQHNYQSVEKCLINQDATPNQIVMANNPPGYFAANRRPAIVIPNGGLDSLLDTAKRYRAKFVILESNHPVELSEVYEHPGDRPGLEYLMDCQGVRVYRIQ